MQLPVPVLPAPPSLKVRFQSTGSLQPGQPFVCCGRSYMLQDDHVARPSRYSPRTRTAILLSTGETYFFSYLAKVQRCGLRTALKFA
jgi:hypothetical protein